MTLKFLFCFITIFSSICFAKDPFIPSSSGFVFKYFTAKDGLPSPSLRAITQDTQGNLWLGTDKGLAIFNGINIRAFETLENNVLSKSMITDLVFESNDVLWVSTLDNGLVRLFLKTKELTQYGVGQLNGGLLTNVIRSVYIDKEGVVWVASRLGLHRYIRERDRFEQILDSSVNGDFLSNYVVKIIAAEDNNLWLGTANGLVLFDKSNRTFKRYLSSSSDQRALPNNQIYALKSYENRLWVGTNKGYVWTSGVDGVFNSRINTEDNSLFCNNGINTFHIDSKKRLWVGTYQGGICLESLTEKTKIQSTSYNSRLTSNNINDIFEDREGNIWIASQGGLVVYSSMFDGFEIVKMKITNSPGAYQSIFTRNEALVASSSLGVARYRKNSFDTIASKTITTNNGAYVSVYIKDRGIFALKKGDSKLYKVEESTLEYLPTTIDLSSYGLNLVIFPSLIALDTNEIGIRSGNKALIVNVDRNNVKRVEVKDFHNWNRSEFQKIGNELWYCDREGTLRLKSLNDQTSGVIGLKKKDDTNNRCTYLNVIGNRLWVYGGEYVYGYNTVTRKKEVNFKERHVRSIYQLNDIIWMVTNTTIIRYDLNTQLRTVYDLGLKEFTQLVSAYYDSESNQLYFYEGEVLIRINSTLIKAAEDLPEVGVNLDSFKLFNKLTNVFHEPSIQADADISFAKTLTLDYQQNMFQIDFSPNRFQKVDKLSFRYRLKNLNDRWIEANSSNAFALFNGVPSGRYIFQVQSKYREQNWKGSIKELEIIVLPPWWRTWWAYCLYLAAFLLALFLIAREVFKRKLAEQERISSLQLVAAKENLFANVSHEFRTPLTIILGHLQQIEKTKNFNVTEMQFNVLKRNSSRLLNLVNQVLDLARLKDVSKKDYKLQNISSITKFVFQSFQSTAEVKKIGFNFTCDVSDHLWVNMPNDAFTMILANLLSNAFKYSSAHCQVNLSINQKDEHVLIKVEDTGTGILQDDLPYIFERFTRLLKNENDVTGSGIGLALVKELVETVEGSIEVSSELGKGTTFIVMLPTVSNTIEMASSNNGTNDYITHAVDTLKQASSKSLITTEVSDDNSESRSLVLIIEDNDDMREFLVSTLARDYRCLSAGDGNTGLALAVEQVPDIIVTDLMIPGINGFKIVEKLKVYEATSHIPIIMLTAKDKREAKLYGLELMVDEFLVKPFDTEELLLRIRNLLSIRQLLRVRYSKELQLIPEVEQSEQEQLDSRDIDFLYKVEKVFEEHFHNPDFSVDEAASQVNLSHRQFQRKLNSLIDLKPNEYLRNVRLKKSVGMLRQGQSVSDVVFACGFSSPSYFTKCFKAKFGTTPSEFLKKNSAVAVQEDKK